MTILQMENLYLSTVASGQQDQDRSRGDGFAQLPPVLTEGLDAVTPQLTTHIFCGVVTGLDTEHRKET